ncbi:MAG: choice-of-anchor Q domain-containing protein, partial [Verrucomicrobiota bacterium]
MAASNGLAIVASPYNDRTVGNSGSILIFDFSGPTPANVTLTVESPVMDENLQSPAILRLERPSEASAPFTILLTRTPQSTVQWEELQAEGLEPTEDPETYSITLAPTDQTKEIRLLAKDDLHAEADEFLILIPIDENERIENPEPLTLTIPANDFVVINQLDDGEGSLRQAFRNAHALGNEPVISFDPASGFDEAREIILSSGPLTIGASMTIQGPDGIDGQLTINGGNDSRIFNCDPGEDASVEFNDLRLTGGNSATGFGGALLVSTGRVRLERCLLENNISQVGGGAIAAFGGELDFVGCTLAENETLASGGGVYAQTSLLHFENSTLSSNRAGLHGGGLFCGPDAEIRLSSSTVTLNEANFGGDGGGDGGGAHSDEGILELKNSLVAGNFDRVSTTTDDPQAPDICGWAVSLGRSLVGESAGFSFLLGGLDLEDFSQDFLGLPGQAIEANLAPLQNNGGTIPTHALQAGATAIDQGTLEESLSYVPQFDQRGAGYPRVIGPRRDIGAYEYPTPIRLTTEDNLVQEGTTAVVQVDRFGDTASPLTLTWIVLSEGTHATEMEDFGTNFPHGELSFEPGEATAEIAFPIADENLVELDERFFVRVTDPGSGRAVAEIELTVLNDDIATLRIDDVSQPEGTGENPTPFTFTVTLDQPVDVPFSLSYLTRDGSARQGEGDFVAIGASTIPGTIVEREPNDSLESAQAIDLESWVTEFNPDIGVDFVTNTSTQLPHITILSNGGNNTDFYSFSAREGLRGIMDIDFGTLGGFFNSALRLFGPAGELLFEAEDHVPDPGSTSSLDAFLDVIFPQTGTYYLEVSRCCFTSIPLEADYQLHISVEDHPLGEGLVFLGDEGEQQQITVDVLADPLVEPTEEFFLDLIGASTGGRPVLLDEGHGTGTIINDDRVPGVEFEVIDAMANEDDGSRATFLIKRETADVPLEVRFMVARSGTAATTDYQITGNSVSEPTEDDIYTVTLSSGQLAAELSLIPEDDDEPEAKELVKLELLPDDLYLLGETTQITLLLNESDLSAPPVFRFVSPVMSVLEGNEVDRIYPVTLEREEAGASLNLLWEVIGGEVPATDEADFGGTYPSEAFEFPADATAVQLGIPYSGDLEIEENEWFRLLIKDAETGEIFAETTGKISNDDGPVISIEASETTLPEDSETPAFLRLTRGITDTPLSVTIGLSPISSAGFADLEIENRSTVGILVSFPDDAPSIDIPIPVFDDLHAEGDEHLVFELSLPSNWQMTEVHDTARLTIPANDSGVINNQDTGEGSLRQAILNQAFETDPIEFHNSDAGPEFATVPQVITLSTPLTIDHSSTIIGPTAPGMITLSSAGESRTLFQFGQSESITARFQRLHFEGSPNETPSACMVLDERHDVRFTDCQFSGFQEGAVRALGSRLTMTGCRLYQNSHSESGGSLVLVNATTTLIECELVANTTPQHGGAIANLGGNLTLFNSALIGNQSEGNGGALVNDGGTLKTVNVTFSGNRTHGNGSGVFNEKGGVATLLHSTITRNRILTASDPPVSSAAVVNAETGGELRFQNTIVANNSSDGESSIATIDISGNFISLDHNLFGRLSNDQEDSLQPNDQFGTPSSPLDAGLGDLAFNGGRTPSHTPLSGSPVIDRGTSASLTPDHFPSPPFETGFTDQRGDSFGRQFGPEVDIGAIEFEFGLSYELWTAEAFTTIGPGPDREPEADPDHDGLPNQLEYLTGLSPESFDDNPLEAELIDDRLVLTWPRRKAAPSGLEKLEFSPNYETWTLVQIQERES